MGVDEAAHYELPHQDVGCLQNQLFWSLVLRALMVSCQKNKYQV